MTDTKRKYTSDPSGNIRNQLVERTLGLGVKITMGIHVNVGHNFLVIINRVKGSSYIPRPIWIYTPVDQLDWKRFEELEDIFKLWFENSTGNTIEEFMTYFIQNLSEQGMMGENVCDYEHTNPWIEPCAILYPMKEMGS